jgi:hypothetical protein
MRPIWVLTIVIESGVDGVLGPSASGDRDGFTGFYDHIFLPDTGHNVPREEPAAFAAAVLRLGSAGAVREEHPDPLRGRSRGACDGLNGKV